MVFPSRHSQFLLTGVLCLLILCIPVAVRSLAINSVSKATLWAASGQGNGSATGQSGLRLVPESERNRLLGRLLLARGQEQAAANMLSWAVEAEPSNALLLAHLGQAHDNLGRSQQAIAAWQRAGDMAHLLRKGERSIDEGQWADAQASLEAAWALAPGVPEVVRPLVRLHQAQGDDGQAAAVLRRAVAEGPDSQTTYYRLWLGQLLERQGEWAGAEAVYRQVLAVDPDDSQAHAGLARSLHGAGSPLPEVEAELEQAKELDPALFEAHMSEGKILRAEGRFQEALASYQSAAELAPDKYWPIAGQARALLDMDDLEVAIAILLEATSRFPNEPHSHYLLAYAYRRAGELEAAIAAAEKAVSLRPEHEEYLLALARTYEAANRSQDVLATYQILLALYPNHPKALERAGALQPREP